MQIKSSYGEMLVFTIDDHCGFDPHNFTTLCVASN